MNIRERELNLFVPKFKFGEKSSRQCNKKNNYNNLAAYKQPVRLVVLRECGVDELYALDSDIISCSTYS